MADKPTFAEIIVSQLGTPPDPFGLDDIIGLTILFAAIATFSALEYGAARFIERLFRIARDRNDHR